MASAARDLRHYDRNGVYGNLAYDLDRELRERELRHAGEARREDARPVPQVRSISRVQVRQRQRVSLFSVAGFTAVVVMAVMVLFCYVQLTEISSEVVHLKSQLAVLETDHAALFTQYQQMYDLSTVKEAAEAAGMGKPSSSQVYYVDLSDGDSAVVYQQEDAGILSRVMASIHQGVYTVMEYFD